MGLLRVTDGWRWMEVEIPTCYLWARVGGLVPLMVSAHIRGGGLVAAGRGAGCWLCTGPPGSTPLRREGAPCCSLGGGDLGTHVAFEGVEGVVFVWSRAVIVPTFSFSPSCPS